MPLLGYVVFFVYRMRRIDCSACRARTEQVPWADGKNRCCNVDRLTLARWARRVSWSEVALIFGVTCGVVNRTIRWLVGYGLFRRDFGLAIAIGVDEIAMWKGHRYLTVVYKIDQGHRRLLWVGKDRTKAAIRAFFQLFGEERAKALRFVAGDMWKPYLRVADKKPGDALHALVAAQAPGAPDRRGGPEPERPPAR